MRTLERSFAVLVRCLAVLILTGPVTAEAQETGKVARVGLLSSGWASDPLVETFRQAMQSLGYVEGRTVVYESRFAEGRVERLPALVGELVRLPLDAIVAGSTAAVAARKATATIPIVMPVITDPVRLGLVASLSRPGGNVTGFATQTEELPGKWLALVKETLPNVSRVAVLWSPVYDGGAQMTAAKAAARTLNLHLQAVKLERPEDLDGAFAAMRKDRAEAVIVSSSPFFYAHRARLIELAAQHRLPAIYHQSDFVAGGDGLMSYGPDFHDLIRRSAGYVDRILRGARPGDLPVQQPIKFELVINRKAAHALDLAIPRAMLMRADRIIE